MSSQTCAADGGALRSLIKKLRTKKYRDEYGLFLVEGEKALLALLGDGACVCKLHALVCTREFFMKCEGLLEKLGVQPLFATAGQLADMGNLESNNAAIAICHKLATAEVPSNESAIALSSIRDPGNLGTILRTAHWFGVKNIICSPDCVDFYNPKVIQASMGSFLHVRVSYADLSDFLTKAKAPVFGAYPTGKNLYDTKIPAQAILVIGSESHGIAPELEPYMRDRVAVPRISENIDSLNAAMATAIICSWWRGSGAAHSADAASADAASAEGASSRGSSSC